MHDNLLEVCNLNVNYLSPKGKLEVLKNISFSLPKGHVLGITGESGSGKTTLALSMLRLISKQKAETKGHARLTTIENTCIDLLTVPETMMEFIRGNSISMVFQEPRSAFNPLFTCGNQIAETIRKHKRFSVSESDFMAKEWLSKTDLSEPERIFYSYPHQLSGGQLQRAMIAMAICCRPSMLIADEPLASSDYSNFKSLLYLFRKMKEESGMSIIFISHDLWAITQIADSVLVLHQGKIIEQGPAEKLFHSPQHSYTQLLFEKRMDLGNNIEPNQKVKSKQVEELQILKVQGLKKIFKKTDVFTGIEKRETNAINGLSFELFEGETLGITGDSGSGKTTLARCLCGLIDADGGQVIFKKKKIFADYGTVHSGKNIQIVFQNPDTSLNPKRTIGNAIMEPLKYYGYHGNAEQQKRYVLQLMEKAGLESTLFGRFPHQLSGGQKQRVVIIRALAIQPEILICDEPVSALDAVIQSQILKLLNELKRSFGFSMIFISHNLPVVKFMSDRIMVIEKGLVKHMGNAEKVYELLNSEQAVN